MFFDEYREREIKIRDPRVVRQMSDKFKEMHERGLDRLTLNGLDDVVLVEEYDELEEKDVDDEKKKKRSKNLLKAALEGWEVSEEELYDLTDEDLITLAKKTFGI